MVISSPGVPSPFVAVTLLLAPVALLAWGRMIKAHDRLTPSRAAAKVLLGIAQAWIATVAISVVFYVYWFRELVGVIKDLFP